MPPGRSSQQRLHQFRYASAGEKRLLRAEVAVNRAQGRLGLGGHITYFDVARALRDERERRIDDRRGLWIPFMIEQAHRSAL